MRDISLMKYAVVVLIVICLLEAYKIKSMHTQLEIQNIFVETMNDSRAAQGMLHATIFFKIAEEIEKNPNSAIKISKEIGCGLIAANMDGGDQKYMSENSQKSFEINRKGCLGNNTSP